MSAPNPVPWNPAFYKPAYQTKQFAAGIPGGADIGSVHNSNIFDALAFPPSGGVAAEAVNPLEEAADNIAHPEAGISGPGDPTAFE
jgi:hypothetical protein